MSERFHPGDAVEVVDTRGLRSIEVGEVDSVAASNHSYVMLTRSRLVLRNESVKPRDIRKIYINPTYKG